MAMTMQWLGISNLYDLRPRGKLKSVFHHTAFRLIANHDIKLQHYLESEGRKESDRHILLLAHTQSPKQNEPIVLPQCAVVMPCIQGSIEAT